MRSKLQISSELMISRETATYSATLGSEALGNQSVVEQTAEMRAKQKERARGQREPLVDLRASNESAQSTKDDFKASTASTKSNKSTRPDKKRTSMFQTGVKVLSDSVQKMRPSKAVRNSKEGGTSIDLDPTQRKRPKMLKDSKAIDGPDMAADKSKFVPFDPHAPPGASRGLQDFMGQPPGPEPGRRPSLINKAAAAFRASVGGGPIFPGNNRVEPAESHELAALPKSVRAKGQHHKERDLEDMINSKVKKGANEATADHDGGPGKHRGLFNRYDAGKFRKDFIPTGVNAKAMQNESGARYLDRLETKNMKEKAGIANVKKG